MAHILGVERAAMLLGMGANPNAHTRPALKADSIRLGQWLLVSRHLSLSNPFCVDMMQFTIGRCGVVKSVDAGKSLVLLQHTDADSGAVREFW